MRSSLILLGCFLLSACRSEDARSRPAGETPVFIVSIDSLRADRLAVYGYEKGSTPNIDAFRADALLYRWAFSNCPQTLPSHVSILTGRTPPGHGVRNNIGYQLSSAIPTLAAQLRERGYGTGAAVSSYLLRRASGLHAGFEFYDDRVRGTASRPTDAERDGEETRAALTDWLQSQPSKRVFALLHLNEPHAPYEAPRSFSRVDDDYDNEVAYADDVFGRFLQTLRSRGLYDDALIILLSDHGEALGDHGEEGHGLFVYRESIHVPLLIKLPGAERKGETVTPAVGLDQVAELVLAVTGGDADPPALLSRDGARAEIYSETYLPRLHFGWSELRSVISADRHFIDAPVRELYDYVRDPGELRNLARSEQATAERLEAAARRIDASFQLPSAIDPNGQSALPTVTARGPGAKAARPAADPKSKAQVVRDLRRAALFLSAGRHRDAIPLAERVVFSEPSIVDGWALLGRSRSEAGQPSLAIEAYDEGLRRFPENSELALLAADEHARARKWEAAVSYAERVLPHDPVLAHDALARIADRRGDDAAARRHAEETVRFAPGRVPTLMLLAELSRRAGRPSEQLMWLDRAEQEVEARSLLPVERLAFHRGQALLALGRSADAEEAFRAEVKRFPRNMEAWQKLAVVIGQGKGRDEMRAVLGEALRVNDNATMRNLARAALRSIGDEEGAKLLAPL